jgi:hypothetical protein
MPETPAVVAMPSTLVDGQRLDQPTFHAFYETMPPGTRAELINGVVLMPGPVGPPHGRANLLTLIWLGFYQANTPGVEALVDTSTALGLKSEPQLSTSTHHACRHRPSWPDRTTVPSWCGRRQSPCRSPSESSPIGRHPAQDQARAIRPCLAKPYATHSNITAWPLEVRRMN